MRLRYSVTTKLKDKEYIALGEAAKIYNYTRDHLGYLIRRGDLRGKKIGSFYFTTHEWVDDYLKKSGKAREKTRRISQSKEQEKTSLSKKEFHIFKDSLGKLKKQKDNFKTELKNEILPLYKDIGEVFRFMSQGIKLATSLFKKIKLSLVDFKTQAKKEFYDWKSELSWFLRKSEESYLSLLEKGAKNARRIISDFNKLLNLFKHLNLSINKAINRAYGFFHKVKIFGERLKREILWETDFIALRQRFLGRIRRPRRIIAPWVGGVVGIFLGGLLVSWAIFVLTPQNYLTDIRATLSQRVETLKSEFFFALPEDSSIKREDFWRFNAQQLSLAQKNTNKMAQSWALFCQRLKTDSAVLSQAAKSSLILLENSIFSFLEDSQKSAIKNIAFLEKKTSQLSKNLKEEMGRLKNDIRKSVQMAALKIIQWQAENNKLFTKAETHYVGFLKDIPKSGIKSIDSQLARLRINFDFIKKPLRDFSSYLAGKFGGKSPESEKLSLGSRNETEETLKDISQNEQGIIVIPSISENERIKETIKKSFSDEVEIEPSETGDSGIIRPIFRQKTDQEYLYLMVPIIRANSF